MYALHNFPMQDVILREADVNTDYDTMCTIEAMWARDYRAAGDTCNTGKAIVDKLFSGRHTKVYIVEVLGKTASFMVLQKQAAAITIDIVYVLPKYRQRGLATQLYQTAISNFGAEQISLSYRRVIAKLPYWQSLGFQSVKGQVGQKYTLKSLCYLSIHSHVHSIVSVPLTKEAIQLYRNSLGSTWDYKVDLLAS